MKIVFATHNSHKADEIRNIIGKDFELLTLDDIGLKEEIEENGLTIQENASIKSHFIYKKFRFDCFADDTGLLVDALDGAPGIYSARFAGEQKNSEDNIDLLLKKLEKKSNRKARFVTVISLLINGIETIFEGNLKGEIIKERRGTNGFGYDSVFMPEGFSRTLAEFSLNEKNKISHRAIAFNKLIDFLKKRE